MNYYEKMGYLHRPPISIIKEPKLYMHHNNIHIKSHWIDAERAQTDIFK